ncbi:carboxyltransferase domain-containing protein [Loktanella sp. SALINAS62]|uniref:5-oxoprolinase subunit B family protein n=1 Tax=Loktanella sp. SALINAS62 TaxID=2706124 RepID=UPI001B8BFFB4|nr:carboxyltransferase domain-containing protein [Loktanella sp. SALINAS62]MBS1303965.1 allophanate hydrolase subunit 1 [Loktanella sp. SALINAS62]
MSTPPNDSTPALFPLGQDGILIRCGDGFAAAPDAAQTLANRVRAADLAGVTEIATSLASVFIRFAPGVVTRAALSDRLRALAADPVTRQNKALRRWTIPASFGGDSGPQLAEAAALAGLSTADAVAEVTGVDLSVLAIGFAPGQPYLGHLGPGWDMPRQQNLSPHVPAGALVVALRQMVLFANASPTGWRWIGTCAFAPFQPDRATPFALRAGDLIRFTATDPDTIDRLRDQPDGLGGAACEGLA